MNIAGLLVITLWTAGLCSLMFGLLKLAGLLRVDRQSEIVGMDITKHGEPAYPVSAYGGDYRHLHDKSDKSGKSSSVVMGGVPIVMPTLSDFKPSNAPAANDVANNNAGNTNAAFAGDAQV